MFDNMKDYYGFGYCHEGIVFKRYLWGRKSRCDRGNVICQAFSFLKGWVDFPEGVEQYPVVTFRLPYNIVKIFRWVDTILPRRDLRKIK